MGAFPRGWHVRRAERGLNSSRLGPGFFSLAVLAIALGSVGIRFFALEASGPILVTGDEGYYLETAAQLALGNGYEYPPRASLAEWPPGYPFFLSLSLDPESLVVDTESAFRAVIAVQVWLGGLLVLLCGFLGRALLGPGEGLVAAFAAAVYPDFVVFSHYVFSETLFTVLLLGGVLALVAWDRKARLWTAAGAGVLFGLAALTREIAIPLAVSGVAWWWLRTKPLHRDRALRHGALLGLTIAMLVLPWTLRNYVALDRFVPVSNAGWLNVRSGNTMGDPDWMRPQGALLEGFRNTYFAIPDEMARADYARDQSLALIRSEQPAWIFKKSARTFALLGSPDSYLFKKISRGAYPAISIETVRVLLLAGAASTAVILLLALPGWVAARGGGARSLALALAGVSFGIHLVANASPRYRFPLMPLAMVFAASTVVSPVRVFRSIRPVEWAGIAVAAFLYLAVAIPYFWPDAMELWQRGTYLEPFRP